uniref:Platelet-derived growth factor (PDGF) family profile domain-containing protein n=1 Tax=Dromaius novaehollandiae TaxID=8790 RepID=A0A8C4P2Z3_DRONO
CPDLWPDPCLLPLSAAPRPSIPPLQQGWPVSACPPSAFLPDLPFLEVYRSSFCQPFLTIVDVYSEYPDEVTYIYKPSCVAVQRCGGCCGDEGQFCAPVEMEMVTIEVKARLLRTRWLCFDPQWEPAHCQGHAGGLVKGTGETPSPKLVVSRTAPH